MLSLPDMRSVGGIGTGSGLLEDANAGAPALRFASRK
jgi:hypothetical protein